MTPKKRKLGRPKLARGLTELLQLRLSREQMARCKANARAAGLTLPEWVRKRLE